MNLKPILFSLLSRLRLFALGLPSGNVFRDEGSVAVIGRLSVVRGIGNTMIVGEGSRFYGRVILHGSNNRVLIGKHCVFRGEIRIKGDGQTVSFGDHSSTVGLRILSQEGCDVSIGRWCMFSREIEIRTTDAHSVIDRKSRKRINLPGSVTIGDHVWVGLRAIVNKGVTVGNDSIVAAGAFVNKSFNEDGVIIAGCPAKVVKRGITWHRGRKAKFATTEINVWRQ